MPGEKAHGVGASPKLVFYRTPQNGNSIMALLGAVEGTPGLGGLSVEVWEDLPGPGEVAGARGRVFFCTSFSTVGLFDAIRVIGGVRDLFPGDWLTVIAGGPHVTGRPGDIGRLGVDYAVVGEGESTLPELLSSLLERGSPKPDSTGIAENTPGGVRLYNPPKPVDLDAYFPFSRQFRWFAPVEISRGCAWRCKFCQTGSMHARVRHRSVPSIRRAVEFQVGRRYPHVRFLAPDAFLYGSKKPREVRPGAIRKLLDATWSVKGVEKVFFGTFPSEVRPDSVKREVLDVVHSRVSNTKLSVGLQTADDRLLKASGRGHTVDDFWGAVDLMLEYGFTPLVDMIFGLPGETEETVLSNLDAVRELLRRKIPVRGHTFLPLAGAAYEDAPPGKVDDRIKKLLSRQDPTAVEGDWREQEVLARRIRDWFAGSGDDGPDLK
ncbi:MAG: TIGR04013 family B12-binding domain/radical SAM domain-containing protein [Promethearchaeota archaeon]